MPDAGADAHGECVLQVFGDGGTGVRALNCQCATKSVRNSPDRRVVTPLRASSTTDAAFYRAICLATVAQAGQSMAERLRWLFCRAIRDRSGHIREPIYCAGR